MSVEAAVRARLGAEIGRVFVEMIVAQEQARERDRIIAVLRKQLEEAKDEIQRGVEP
jgi:hypothetical protein